MSVRGDDLFTIADVLDSQLVSKDGKAIGRVADVEAQWDDDGKLVLTVLVAGPQVLAGRVLRPLRSLLQRLLHDRFERTIPLCEVEEFGPTLQLRGKAEDYTLGQADRWLAEHVLRWLPFSGFSESSGLNKGRQLHSASNDTHHDEYDQNDSEELVILHWERKGMGANATRICISDLLGCKIVTAEGQCLGRVMDIQLSEGPEYSVIALMFGRGALMHRWHVLNPFRTHKEQVVRIYCVPWEAVGTLEKAVIRLNADVGEEIPKRARR